MSAPIAYRRRGQAVWLDSISNKMIRTGRLSSLIDAGAIYGVTSNPTIFGQAIEKNEGDYNAGIERLAREGKDAFAIYDALTRQDIAEGADAFRAIHDRNPVDGWISLEVLPSLARDTEKTVAEARRLASALGRPNVFIKVPATPEGVPAIRRLIGEGVSINVTLMFNRKHYRDVALAYLGGLAGPRGEGRRPLARPLRRVVLRVARGHADRQAPRREGRGGVRRRRRPASRRCAARPASRTARSSTRTSARSSAPSRSRRSAGRARGCRGRSGPRPARRTRRTPTFSTSRTSSATTR